LNRALHDPTVVSPQVTLETIGQALAIGILADLYPAWRGTSVSPLADLAQQRLRPLAPLPSRRSAAPPCPTPTGR